MSKKKQHTYIGIDVSKASLEVAVYESDYKYRCANQEKAFGPLLAELICLQPQLIVLEATGGLERPVLRALQSAGLPAAVVNPRQVRDFAKATGQLAKTDRLDANVLAHFAAVIKPPPQPRKSQDDAQLDALAARRRQLTEILKDEKNRRTSAATETVSEDIKGHIDWLEDRIAELDQQLKKLVESSPVWQRKAEILQSAPGVGWVTCAALLADLPELGTLNRQQLSKLVGVAPLNRDSGKYRGSRHIYGGRAPLRSALYMPMLAATCHNQVIKEFYQRLRAQQKPFKVALIACMRKLLTILNVMVRDDVCWNDQLAAA